ncbi:MAG: D-alanine--D-alanine ligase family protein [Planctomycetota bacterium]|jgi:D-alanine-D-alanine ligase
MRRLRVLVLLHAESVPPESVEGMTDEEIFAFRMEHEVLQALRALGHEVKVLPVENELAPIRMAIEEWQPHIAFNLLMSFHNIGIYDAHVVSYLELLKTPYTGSNPRGILLSSDKGLSKKILTYHRIRVPDFAVFRKGRPATRPKKLAFPLIVKSDAEHASEGISQASVVNDDESLKERVDFVHRHVHTNAIAEEYIEGRELTIGVLGNHRLTTLPIWEMTFANLPKGSEPIATARIKSNLEYQKKIGLKTGPANNLDAAKKTEIHRIAKRVYKALSLSGFARVDLRLAPDGRVYVLEANPNADLCTNEDIAQSAASSGVKYEDLIQRIVNLGLGYEPAWKGQ